MDDWHAGYAKAVGGSGKHKLADGSCLRIDTIGKLRRLRLPMPPGIHQVSVAAAMEGSPDFHVNNQSSIIDHQ
jgi:hypothetical protein